MLAAGLVQSTASAQNVLANPGFEVGSAVGSPDVGGATGWTAFGNTFTTSAPNPLPPGPHAGTGALKEFGTFSGVSGAFQDFPATPGTIWQLTGFGLNASSDPMQPANFGLAKISFQGASGEILGIDSNHIDVNTPSNIWTPLLAQGVAPAGTTHVQLFALFVQPAFNGGSAFFDDFSGQVIPEPASIGLLGLAGGLLSLRRRRA
jgi:hypothetical protein